MGYKFFERLALSLLYKRKARKRVDKAKLRVIAGRLPTAPEMGQAAWIPRCWDSPGVPNPD
jgi:hypothetical protein